jgi:hypothetical protein
MSVLKNMDPLSSGKLETRTGYEQFGGCVPLRASSFSKTDTTYEVEFDLPSTIDLGSVAFGPIVVAGKVPSDAGASFTGDFSDSFAAHWYSTFTVGVRETFASGTPATHNALAADTGISDANLFVGWHQSDSTANLDNTLLTPETITITQSNYNIAMTYESATSISGIFTWKEVPSDPGNVYIKAVSGQPAGQKISITGATHNLNNGNFIIRCYNDSGGNYVETVPETVTTTSSNSDIDVTFTDAFTGNIIIYAAENDHIVSAVAGDQTFSVTGVTSPFNFWEVWAVSGGTRTMVTPEEITWDASTETASIDYVGPGVESVEIFWTPADYRANYLTFEGGDGGVDFDTDNPEITVWGICHSGIYRTGVDTGGFTNHLDNYKSESSDKMVTGLGGNMFQSQTYADAGSTWKMASLQLRGQNRVSGSHVLAPLFSGDSPGYTRTRGNVTDSSIDGDGYAKCTTVAWSSGTSVNYTLAFDDDMTGTLSLGTEISTNDWLTIRNCGHDRNNGTFKISAVSISTTDITFTVTNSAVTDATQDEANISAQANVFTDEILLAETPIFLVGDKIVSSDTSANTIKSVDVSSSNYIYIDGISSNTSISDGLGVYTRRTSSILPLQDFPAESIGDDTDGGFVNGENLSITGVTQSPKIIYSNNNSTVSTSGSLSLSVASGTCTATLTDHGLSVGQKVAFYASSDTALEGEFTVVDVPTVNTFTFTTTAGDGSPTATMLGKTVEIDESIQLDAGPTLITVETASRWVPVENPGTSQSRGVETKTRHWDENTYVAQNYLRSVIVGDSMFNVNDKDEVKKFDGSNLTNAGIIPWQAWGFLTVDATTPSLPAGASVPWDNGSSNPNANGYFVVGAPVLPVGSRFKSSASSVIYTVSLAETDDVNETRIYVEEAINGSDNTSTGILTRSNIMRYYVRLNAVDANRNIVASAMLGSDDLICETFTSSAVQLKVIGLPPFAEIDYDRIEVELYRTKRNTVGPFYRVYRRLLDYGDLGGYLVLNDTTRDEQLGVGQLDIAPAGFNAVELGNQWDKPPLASAVTTVDNRLVLANIKSPPILDIVFTKDTPQTDLVVADFSGGTIELVKSDSVSSSETFKDASVYEFISSGSTAIAPANDLHIANSNTSLTISSFTNGTEIVTTSTTHNLKTGVKVQLVEDNTLPAELAESTTYYVIEDGATTLKLASTLEDAGAGTAIDFTDDGSLTNTMNVIIDHVSIASSALADSAVGDWVYLFHSAAGETNLLDFAGWYRITEAAPTNNYVIIDMDHNRTTGAAGTNDVDQFCVTTTAIFTAPLRVPVWIGDDGNFNQLYHDNAPIETRVATRLSLAINATQSSDDPNNTYWATTVDDRPTPWLMARSGLSFPTGALQLRLVDNPSASFTVEHNGFKSGVKTFVNNVALAATATSTSEIRLFNSRLSVSYPNYPEIHDNPFADPSMSDSVIDVNPSDGQEITAVMPFFGQSAFGNANLAQAVVVFKTASVYLVDVQTRQWQRLQSQAQGCTAPRSPAATKDGIIFANESGIYRLGWDMKIDWVGKFVNDLWNDDLDLADIAEFAGHNYKQKRRYKISTVISGSNYPSNVLSYDHTRETLDNMGVTSGGSWTEYTNHAATGWANQSKDAFWGNQAGQVFRVRNYGTAVDYRDDASAIAEQQFITGGIHYGLPGNRKTTSAVTLQYQNDYTLTDINVSTEQSLSGTFNASTQVDITNDHQTVRYALADRKGTHLRVKMTKSSTKDEKVELSRITAHAKDISHGGVTQAADL